MKIKDLKSYSFGDLINEFAVDRKIRYCRKQVDKVIPVAILGYADPKIRDYISDQTTPRFVLKINNAQIHCNPQDPSLKGAVIISESGKIIRSKYLDHQHIEEEPFSWAMRYSEMDIPKPSVLVKGSTLYLSTLWWHSYYHFHVEVIGKLFIAKYFTDIEQYDQIIIPGQPKKFMFEMLEKLNILNKIRVEPSQSILYENVTIPSLSANMDGYIPYDLVEFLRDSFGKKQDPIRKIYVSRKDAFHRRVINEQEIINIVKMAGFELVTLEGLSFFEQVMLFSSAKIVIAPHGAGLTNLIYCSSETIVYEMFSTNYINKAYTELCSEIGIEYYYSAFPGNDDLNNDYHVDVRALKEFIEKVDK